MKKVSKGICILSIIVLSILLPFFTSYNSLIDFNFVIQLLLSMIGICITSYVFISILVGKIGIKTIKLKDMAKELLEKLEEDILSMIYSIIFVIIISFFAAIDFIHIKDFSFAFYCFYCFSIKTYIIDVLIYFICFINIRCFIDFIKATFTLTKYIVLEKEA